MALPSAGVQSWRKELILTCGCRGAWGVSGLQAEHRGVFCRTWPSSCQVSDGPGWWQLQYFLFCVARRNVSRNNYCLQKSKPSNRCIWNVGRDEPKEPHKINTERFLWFNILMQLIIIYKMDSLVLVLGSEWIFFLCSLVIQLWTWQKRQWAFLIWLYLASPVKTNTSQTLLFFHTFWNENKCFSRSILERLLCDELWLTVV